MFNKCRKGGLPSQPEPLLLERLFEICGNFCLSPQKGDDWRAFVKAPWFNKGAVLSCLIFSITLTAGFATAAVADDPDPDRYIVSFLDVGKGKAALRAAGARIELELTGREAAAAHIPARALNGLRNNPHIEYIEPDALRYPMAETMPYGITMVQADQLDYQGGVKVCIIDSGYYKGHEDLQDAGVTGKNNSGSGDPFTDGCGHGTHVAGTIAALANGKGVVGVNSTGSIGLHIVKVFGNATEGNCGWTYSSSLVAALDECVSPGVDSDIVSMSLGGTFKSRTEDRAFAQAFNQGVLSVAAAGNDGNTRMSYPASYASVMSVAAIDSSKVVADFSQQNDQVEIAAPGVGVLSTLPVDVTAEITIGSTTYGGDGIENAAEGSATGAVANGGLCDSVGPWSGKVVMCQRGNISFYDKVMNVQAGGGLAAVIYNNVSGGFAGTLGDGNSSSIPAISLSQEDGQAIVGTSVGLSGHVVNTADWPASGYAAWDGTSMATPHVSGVAALVWSNHWQCTNAQIRNALNMTAEDLGAGGRDNAYGYGLVQAKAASDFLDVGCDGPGSGGGGGGGGGGGQSCSDLGQNGDSCELDSDCCSGTCKGKPGAKTCK